ncbi:MAG: helix-turn-helix domain-containing protein [Paludibacter sp.]|nr:helix-turn-helix domain-containing protein [Paludibacter sp.]
MNLKIAIVALMLLLMLVGILSMNFKVTVNFKSNQKRTKRKSRKSNLQGLSLKEWIQQLMKRLNFNNKKLSTDELEKVKIVKDYSKVDLVFEELKELFVKMFEELKLYKNPNLNMDMVAMKLNTNRTYVSRVINENYKKSFTSVVNEYRYKEAEEILKNNPTIKADQLAQQSGFNSKETFVRTLKKLTGKSFMPWKSMVLRK